MKYINVDWDASYFDALNTLRESQFDDSVRIHPADAHRVIDFLLRQQPRPLPFAVSDAYSGLRKLVSDYSDVLRQMEGADAQPQPIETAPKDGTWILVWAPDYDCWMSAQWGCLAVNPNKYGDGDKLPYGWGGNGYNFPDVTHWLPMPALPEVKK
jgi:hypothetical protein